MGILVKYINVNTVIFTYSFVSVDKETMKKLNLDAINNKNIKKAMENRTRRIVASEFDKLRKTLEKKIQEKFQKDVKNAQRDIEKRKKDAEKQIEQDKKDIEKRKKDAEKQIEQDKKNIKNAQKDIKNAQK